MDQSSNFIILMGPVAVGKTTILKRLLAEVPDSAFLVTTTTRAPRPGEVPGKDFIFYSREEFIRRRDAGEFLETAEHAGHLYGSSRKILEDLQSRHRWVFTILNIPGVRQLQNTSLEYKTIFVLPGSFSEIESPLYSRAGAAQDNPGRRLALARDEIATADEWNFVVKNEEGKLGETITKIKNWLY